MKFFGKLDPCLSCQLPDCDEGSPRCGLKIARNRYEGLRNARKHIPDEVHAGFVLFSRYLQIDRRARLSEEAQQ